MRENQSRYNILMRMFCSKKFFQTFKRKFQNNTINETWALSFCLTRQNHK